MRRNGLSVTRRGWFANRTAPDRGVGGAAPASALPERIGGYPILERIGSGGMGTVYRAIQENVGRREVAIKVMNRADPDLVRRMHREIEVQGRSRDPRIVQLYDSGIDETGRPFFVMEYCAGGSVSDQVRDRPSGRLSVEEAGTVIADIADALASLHEAGVVHRDVKPKNILLTELGSPRLGDFGVVQVGGETTTASDFIGTLAYAAPELLGGSPTSAASDTFSFGVTAYELLAGVRPYDGATPVGVLDAVRQGRREPLADLVPQCPPAVVSLVEACLDPDPDRRPQDLRTLAHTTRTAITCQPVAVRSQTRPPGAASQPSSRHNETVSVAPPHAPAVARSDPPATRPTGSTDEQGASARLWYRASTLQMIVASSGLVANVFLLTVWASWTWFDNYPGGNNTLVLNWCWTSILVAGGAVVWWSRAVLANHQALGLPDDRPTPRYFAPFRVAAMALRARRGANTSARLSRSRWATGAPLALWWSITFFTVLLGTIPLNSYDGALLESGAVPPPHWFLPRSAHSGDIWAALLALLCAAAVAGTVIGIGTMVQIGRSQALAARAGALQPTVYAAPTHAHQRAVPAEWLEDPTDPNGLRWWDGERWTEHRVRWDGSRWIGHDIP